MFQVLVPLLSKQTAEASPLAGVEVEVEEEVVVAVVAAVNYQEKIDLAASVPAGFAVELLALLWQQPTL